MVQAETLKIGDINLAREALWPCEAMFDHKGEEVKGCRSSTPVQY